MCKLLKTNKSLCNYSLLVYTEIMKEAFLKVV